MNHYKNEWLILLGRGWLATLREDPPGEQAVVVLHRCTKDRRTQYSSLLSVDCVECRAPISQDILARACFHASQSGRIMWRAKLENMRKALLRAK